MVGFYLLNQSARERVFPKARARNVGTLIMFAVRRALSQPERLRALLGELTERGAIDRDAAREGPEFLLAEASSLPEAAYRYCRHEPGVHVTLSGTSNEAHLLENIASLAGPPLSLASRERLQRLFAQIDDISGQ